MGHNEGGVRMDGGWDISDYWSFVYLINTPGEVRNTGSIALRGLFDVKGEGQSRALDQQPTWGKRVFKLNAY